MHVLVAYASRHGATRGIAERIAEILRREGLDTDLRPARTVRDVAGYDAFVIGSAAYMFHWLKDATELVRRNERALAGKPVWLFSSGPIGDEPLDAAGRDQKVAAVPKELPGLAAAVRARDHHVFFGAFDPSLPPIGLAERVAALLPAAARNAMPSGDFRDWPEIEAWAQRIARELRPVVREPEPVAAG
jgi:menaquinone-dependent protoporphyrinogen oxidase